MPQPLQRFKNLFVAGGFEPPAAQPQTFIRCWGRRMNATPVSGIIKLDKHHIFSVNSCQKAKRVRVVLVQHGGTTSPRY